MNKLYKKELIKGIKFPVGRDLMEDCLWTAKVLLKTNKLKSTGNALYNIRLTNDSISRNKRLTEKKTTACFANKLERDLLLVSKYNNLNDEAKISSINFIMNDLHQILSKGYNLKYWDNYKTIKELAKNIKNQNNIKLESNNNKLIDLIINSSSSKSIQKKYFLYLFFSFNYCIKAKLKLIIKILYSFIVRLNRININSK